MKTLITLFTILLTGLSFAQNAKQTQYGAYLQASKTMWEKSVSQSKKQYGAKSLETAIALYGVLNNTMATQDEETFEQYEDETIDLLKAMIEENPSNGEAKAILSSVYGLVMAYSPMKGMIYGMKSSSLMTDAMDESASSPLVQRLYAGSKLYTPEMWGGDAEEAAVAFKKAIDLYAKSGDTKENWQYLDAMMGLAMAFKKTNQASQAKSTLEEAIALEPQYYWAKSELAKFQ
ncbi:MAG: tetratricopeptide repeat protein [Bacteroidota bacterium]